MKKFFNVLACLFVFLSVQGQSYILKGKIIDAETKEPLIGASVSIDNGNGTTTDFDGNYSISLSEKKVSVTYTYVGFEPFALLVEMQGDTTIQNLELKPSNNILQTATVTSGKYEKPLGEATVSLEVIKPSLIENTNTVSIETVLDKIPSVNIIDGQANIRGGSGFSYGAGSRVLLLIDDLPALQGDAGFPNWNFVPVENIAQLEVVKGAASALYGSSALNGIINIRTAYPTSEPYTQVSLFSQVYTAPADTQKHWWNDTTFTPIQYGASFAHRQKFGKFDLVLGGFYSNEKSFRKDEFTKFGRINANTRYRVTDKLSLGLNVNYQNGSSGNFILWQDDTTGAYLPFNASITTNDNSRIIVDPSLLYFTNNGMKHRLTGRFYRIKNQQQNDVNDQSVESNILYGEYQFQKKFDDLDLTLIGGLVANGIYTTAALYGDSTYSALNQAIYLQADKKFGDRLNVSVGVRWEANNIESPSNKVAESRPVGRLGLNYQAAEYTYLRTSFGQGYRFPTIAEKFIRTCVGGQLCIYPNDSLLSETGWTTEIGIKQGFKIGEFKGFVDVAGFWMEYQDMMEFTFGRYGTLADPVLGFGFASQNIGNTVIKGIDFSVAGTGQIGGATHSVLLGYTYIDPKFKDFESVDTLLVSLNENILKYRFEHSFKVDVESQFNQFTVGVAVLYNSFMKNIDEPFNQLFESIGRYREANQTGTLLFNARVSYKPIEQLKVSIVGKNLLNTEYSLRPGLLEAPRNIALRLDYNF